MELAQTLYEKKFLTYPRTSSRHLSKAVAEEIEAHVRAASVGPYVPFIEKILAGGKPKLTSRHVDDKKVTDHHAVIPTKQQIKPDALSPDEKRIYDLVARRFLAAFYPDAELERTTVVTEAEGERFITRGTVVLKAGWREVEPPGRSGAKSPEEGAKKPGEDDEEESGELPALKAKDPAEVLNAEAQAKQTKAPPRYSESSLLGAMETAGKKVEDEELRLAMKEAGLGTPATRASIIETLVEARVRHAREEVARRDGEGRGPHQDAALAAAEVGRADGALGAEALAHGAARVRAGLVHGRGARDGLGAGRGRSPAPRSSAPPPAPARRARQLPRPEGALDCPKCKKEERAGFLSRARGRFGEVPRVLLGPRGVRLT